MESQRTIINKLTVNASKGYQKFSDSTSMHGFNELYYTKSRFFKIVWLLVIGAAIILTIYQTQQAIYQYLYQSSSTLIQPVPQAEIVYPTLKVCFNHWLQWVDWDVALGMGFTKGSLLYAMSFLTKIYSKQDVDIKAIESNFVEVFETNRFSSIINFLRSVSKSIYADSTLISEDNIFYFNVSDSEVMPISSRFCHVAAGSLIAADISKSKDVFYQNFGTTLTNSFTIRMFIDATTYKSNENIDSDEYERYIVDHFSLRDFESNFPQQLANNYTKFVIPVNIFPIGFEEQSVEVIFRGANYKMSISMSAYNWMNKPQRPCNESVENAVSSNMDCKTYCLSLPNKHNYCSSLLNKDYSENRNLTNVCRNQIMFYSVENDNATSSYQEDSIERNSNSLSLKQCTLDCAKKNSGCKKWKYDVTVETKTVDTQMSSFFGPDDSSIVEVVYLTEGDIYIMTEVSSQSWENFVGNIGGLLGIWTGASLLSLFQTFYLCCCAEATCFPNYPSKKLSPVNSRQIAGKVFVKTGKCVDFQNEWSFQKTLFSEKVSSQLQEVTIC